MKGVSTFAGIGGFDLGFHRAGIDVIAHAENEPNCSQLLADKFPHAVALNDVRALIAVMNRMRRGQPVVNHEDWKRRIELLRTADVWSAGFPCQDLSVAGTRAGLAGERSGLWFAFRRIAALFRPAWLVLENVPGLLSSQQGRDLATVLSGLAELGYWWAYRVYDAQFFGLAQRRQRVVIVASLGTLRCAEVLFESESLCWDSPPSREAGERIAPTVEGRAGRSGATNFATSGGLAEVPECANPIGAHHRRDDLDHDTYIPIQSINMKRERKQNGIGIGKPGDPMFTVTSRDHHAVAFSASNYKTGEYEGGDTSRPLTTSADRSRSAPIVAFTQNQRNEVRELEVAGAVSGIRRGDAKNETVLAFTQNQCGDVLSGDVAAALSTNANATGRNSAKALVNHGVRRLTPLECERLQGFPDNWTAGFADSTRYRMTGNAFPPPMAEFIAKRILALCKPPTNE